MPLVNIQIMEGRSPEKIEALLENVTNTIMETLDAPRQNVRVIVQEIPKTHWGIGGASAEKLGR
ncbi:4-oxalocrotonate tautomerase [Oceanobacillus piezotolerans]|uniref:Tautomerase n=1 Tax=Oceanobacillus piezotolerans TaxID=2448030 RepID=A0A498DAP2_9BACI|nr:4-oxalocrotonate tautomerase [Oceanobacillus piezotolerans]RLL45100.1 4-oxalocrotonate tautomerase [Oceanobacillus piezotolerans]